MRTLRTLLLLLIAFALPMYGYASAVAVQCPIHAHDPAAGAEDEVTDAADCGHAGTKAADAKATKAEPCKSGQCKTGSTPLPAVATAAEATPPVDVGVAFDAPPPCVAGAADIWRPPTAS